MKAGKGAQAGHAMGVSVIGNVGQVVAGGELNQPFRITMGGKGKRMTVETGGKASHHWARGYFCAVAALLREEEAVTTAVRSLFAAGGDAAHADPEDQALFLQYGLMAKE
ncbi:hypothetical protein [Cupriavidus pampae]|uniref:Uncharacterized protein n=1 Tax=Cupriavidus pampae TaxID=659251 RepID=A0ABM8XUJ9_9BURK|nr:hypothetical protein [Cupriavidus pampae]CAG9183903.1 hypothetical protein LMG32289_05458 [Cupriavidus pampae]